MAEEKYVEATQDGIVRLFFENTSSEITGLYTQGLETCFVLIIIGDKGISLIHDSGKISKNTFKQEFEFAGVTDYCEIVYNKRAYLNGDNTEKEFSDEIKRYEGLISEFSSKGSGSSSTNSDFDRVFVRRNSEIKVDDLSGNKIPPNGGTELRLKINEVNNYYSHEEDISGDLQFDGTQLTAIPSLSKSKEVMANMDSTISKYKYSPMKANIWKHIQYIETNSKPNKEKMINNKVETSKDSPVAEILTGGHSPTVFGSSEKKLTNSDNKIKEETKQKSGNDFGGFKPGFSNNEGST